MPHVIVKLYPGRSEQQKKRLTEEIVKALVRTIDCDESWISVAIEEVRPSEWEAKVHEPDIVNGTAKVYKRAGD